MRRWLWLLGATIGAATVLASALMFLAAIAAALLVVPLARRPAGRAAVSGEIMAFGGLRLALIVAESASGGTLENPVFWTAVGVGPLLVGAALLVSMFVPTRQPLNDAG